MTSTAPATTSRRNRIVSRVGIVLAALLALVELVSTVPNVGGLAPIAIDLTTITVDVATLVGIYPAWKGRAWGLWLVIISRAITFLPTLPVFFAPEAADFIPAAATALAITLVAIVLTAFGLRRK